MKNSPALKLFEDQEARTKLETASVKARKRKIRSIYRSYKSKRKRTNRNAGYEAFKRIQRGEIPANHPPLMPNGPIPMEIDDCITPAKRTNIPSIGEGTMKTYKSKNGSRVFIVDPFSFSGSGNFPRNWMPHHDVRVGCYGTN